MIEPAAHEIEGRQHLGPVLAREVEQRGFSEGAAAVVAREVRSCRLKPRVLRVDFLTTARMTERLVLAPLRQIVAPCRRAVRERAERMRGVGERQVVGRASGSVPANGCIGMVVAWLLATRARHGDIASPLAEIGKSVHLGIAKSPIWTGSPVSA